MKHTYATFEKKLAKANAKIADLTDENRQLRKKVRAAAQLLEIAVAKIELVKNSP